MRVIAWLGSMLGALVLPSCEDDAAAWTVDERGLLGSLSPIGAPPDSPGNAYAEDEAAAELGHRIFFDPGFSRSGRVACSTCHDPARAFTDGRRVAFGLGRGSRNTPTLLGAQWSRFQGWDGHTDSVWAQTLTALTDPTEHGLTPSEVATRIENRHAARYEAVFGRLEDRSSASDERIFVNVGKALEAYVRRLVPGPAPFDGYVEALEAGDPEGGGHLSPAARRGARAFLREGCVSCHSGPLFTDGEFHNLGLPPSIGVSDLHLGRGHGARRAQASRYRCGSRFSDATTCDDLHFLNPDFEDFEGAFKTPTLRNVELTGPYMHTGQLETLEDVVEHYRKLPGAPRVGRRDPQLRPLGRSVRPHDVAAFLRTLSGAMPEARWLTPPRD
jgi:cytochrome c peroxidase